MKQIRMIVISMCLIFAVTVVGGGNLMVAEFLVKLSHKISGEKNRGIQSKKAQTSSEENGESSAGGNPSNTGESSSQSGEDEGVDEEDLDVYTMVAQSSSQSILNRGERLSLGIHPYSEQRFINTAIFASAAARKIR